MPCLTTMSQSTDQWDALIVPILSNKLDSATNRDWETKINSEIVSRDEIPTYREFISVLNQKHVYLKE